MKLEGYTPEIFLENFIKDSEAFGLETTQTIYEEIFSALTGKKVKLGGFVKMLEETVTPEALLEDPMVIDYAAQAVNQACKTPGVLGNTLAAPTANGKVALGAIMNGTKQEAAKAVGELTTKQGLLAKIGTFITSLPGKVKAFFGGLQGKSFGEIMKQGMGWLRANPALALKTTGGIALVALLIRALKKRKELNKYKALQAVYDKSVNEDFEDDDAPEAIAMKKIVEECQTNKALNELIFGEGEENVKTKSNYFAY